MFSKIKQFMCDQHDLNEVVYKVFNNKNCQMAASICFMTYFDLTGFYNCYKKLYPDLPKLIYDQRILNEIILTKLRSKCLSFRNFNFLKLKVKNGATEFSWFQFCHQLFPVRSLWVIRFSSNKHKLPCTIYLIFCAF